MAQFVDKQDRAWDLHITFSVIKRVRQTTGINLLRFGALDDVTDPYKLLDMVYCSFEEQAKEHGFTVTALREMYEAGPLLAVMTPFQEALAEFSYGPKEEREAKEKAEANPPEGQSGLGS